MITVTPTAISLAKSLIVTSEGFRASPYRNAHDVWTNGYGHTKSVTAATPIITVKQGLDNLNSDMLAAIIDIRKHVNHALTDHQLAALIDFVFNLGSGAFDTSTILVDVNTAHLADVPVQLKRWVHNHAGEILPGLVTRRDAEIALWNTPDSQGAFNV